jgi:hypothetical protein
MKVGYGCYYEILHIRAFNMVKEGKQVPWDIIESSRSEEI